MIKDLPKIKDDLMKLFRAQPLAVLSTQQEGQPYASLVAFASSDDLTRLYFATIRSTRKFANIMKDSRVAMLIDNRSNNPADFQQATTVTATGRTVEVAPGERSGVLELYLAKHPDLKNFVNSPTCVLCEVGVGVYFVCSNFQNVVEVHINK
ncbi:MAG: pyridoxamine 5'-phosphate oxidase family protein [Acidobacteria bacterium]|nr:pyridoxamine 5'-phosphate oxidase family protein [Acidobacteriota bacterium]